MNRTRMVSSKVDSLAYDEAALTLEVEFKSGEICQYHSVPPSVFLDLLEASSLGGFLSQTIAGTYSSTKVETAKVPKAEASEGGE